MPPKQTNISLKSQLERAERKGRKEGHDKGMTDLLALVSAADASFSRKFRNSSLLNAAKRDDMELLSFFLKAGADVDASNKKGRTALYVAVKKGNIKIVKALLKAGAMDQDDIALVKVLLAAGALRNGNQLPGDARWLICYDEEGDQVKMTRAFIKAGAYLGPYHYNDFCTPLMLAASNGKAASAALLIKAGCDANARHLVWGTVLMMTARESKEGTLDTIRLLLKAGSEVNGKSLEGRTALICAAEAGHSEAVRLLMSAGANVFYQAPSRPRTSWGEAAIKGGDAFDLATNDAVKEIIMSEMHRRIAAVLSVLPPTGTSMPVDVRQNILQLYLCSCVYASLD